MEPTNQANETARIEAFSDGVFAIAITLLVLNLRPPAQVGTETLKESLFRMWPSYWGFVVSFFTILVMWVNHHRLFRLIIRTDDWLLLFNGLLLLCVTFVPFPTTVLAERLMTQERRTASVFYSGTFLALAICYNMLWWCVAHRDRLIDPVLSHSNIKSITRKYLFAPFLYLAAIGLAYINSSYCLALTMILACIYAFPAGLVSNVVAKRVRRRRMIN